MSATDFLQLFEAYFEGSLSEAETGRLTELLHHDETLRARFLQELQLCNILTHVTDDWDDTEEFVRSFWERVRAEETADQFACDFEKRRKGETEPAGTVWSQQLVEAIDLDEHAAAQQATDRARKESEARKEEIRKAAEKAFERFLAEERRRQEELAYKRYRAQRRRLIIGAGAAAVLLIIVATAWLMQLGSVLTKRQAPTTPVVVGPPPVVARITQSLDARWLHAGRSTQPGTPLTASSLSLVQGLVELRFDNGTQVVVQAPADLQLEDVDQMFLQGGTVSARIVEKGAGFIVRTPTGTVVDYGTEFGVIANCHGETEVLVYEGEVGLRSGSDPVRAVASQILTKGQAGAVNVAGDIVAREFRPRQVIREMPKTMSFGIPGKRFDLADALVGGNGYGTGQPRYMVDIRTGVVSALHRDSTNLTTLKTVGTQAPSLPFVDFLFLANSDPGPCTVSSLGHQFTDCPVTDGEAYFYISNSGMVRHLPGVVVEPILNGRRYGTSISPVISIHANAGVTFDLQAIRVNLPGTRIARFTTVCGISHSVERSRSRDGNRNPSGRADFWVLVDGQVRFNRPGVQVQSGGAPVNIDLTDDDRFLSLVVTDGGDGNGYDWGVFGEPALELHQNERINEQTDVRKADQ